MDYVEFEQTVLQAVVRAYELLDAYHQASGVEEFAIAKAMGYPEGELAFESQERLAILDALKSLSDRVLVKYDYQGYARVAPLPQGRALLKGTPYPEWQEIFSRYIEDDQAMALRIIAEYGQREMGRVIARQEISAHEMAKYLGWVSPETATWENVGMEVQFRVYQLFSDLEEVGFADVERVAGNQSVRCTYAGFVRATRKPIHEKLGLLDQLIAEWETPKIEFKRQVSVQDNDGKAEFIKDLLALANTLGKRGYLVVGIDEETRGAFVGTKAILTTEQVNQLVSAYCEPFINVTVEHLPYQGITVELLTVMRESRDVPYRVKKGFRGAKRELKEGDVFVRHGRIVERPTEAELQDLIEESAKAQRDPRA